MKVADIIKNIDKSEDNMEHYIDTNVLAYDLGFTYYFDIDEASEARFKVYWLENWHCTDSWVGTRVYFFDDEPIALSVQNGRKSDENVFWVSKDAAEKVYDFFVSLQKNELNIRLCDMNEDIGNSYKIEFNTQVLDWSFARYKGSPIDFIERIKETPDYGIDQEVKIRVQDTGEELIVNIKELDFLYHLENNDVKSVDELIVDATQQSKEQNCGNPKNQVEYVKE